jgi:NADPH-dependent ferric siderophore reductase
MTLINKTPQRIRHEVKARLLTVSDVSALTPHMTRITLTGEDIAGFVSAGFDDHVKVFVTPEGQPAVRPTAGPDGLIFPDGHTRPPMRDYTPRRYDEKSLTLDFVLHGDGPASSWAAKVKVGEQVLIAGPRGSMIVPMAFDWYLLAGDETALPAIGRRIEELPAGAKVLAFIEIPEGADRQAFDTKADATITWLPRHGAAPGSTTLIADAIFAADFPSGDAFAFIAGEASMSRAVKTHLLETRAFNSEWIKAAGYWVLGEEGH